MSIGIAVQYRDQLGNVGVSYARNADGEIEVVDANDFYPFGMNFLKIGTANFAQGSYKNYKYNGKELQETGMYDYGARFYMPDIGRWGVADPLAEKYPEWSPYNYVMDNPIRFIDLDGRKPEDGIITIVNGRIVISSSIYLYGAGATRAVATQYQKDINSRWGGSYNTKTSDGKQSFNVSVKVNVGLYEGKEKNDPLIIPESWNPFNRDNFIEVDATYKRSHVTRGDEGEWRSRGRDGNTLAQDDPAPHELGHLLGLDDRYDDKNGANKGWENNIMGNSRSGKVEQKNIDAILQDAMKTYETWSKDKNNTDKVFKYEINTNNPNKENR